MVHVLHPEVTYLGAVEGSGEHLPDTLGTADLVEHRIAAAVLERIPVRIEFLDGSHHIELGHAKFGPVIIGVEILHAL